ncbi:MAG: FkbM family methyltransferase [Bacteroidota bacterium]|nr:FkbM family methyltransferase [Bacteroidota bacterium]
MQLQALWDYFKFRVRGLPKPDTKPFDFIQPGSLVFDVGANLGNYSAVFLEKNAKVIAVEPQSYCIDFLKLRFGKNSAIKIIHCGLGANEEEKELMVSSAHTLSSFNKEWVEGVNKTERFKPSNAVWEKKERISMRTLDGLIKEYGLPSYLKIDVEGYEKEVLRGLSRPVETVSFEFTIPELANDAVECVRMLAAIGLYEFQSVKEDKSDTWISTDEIEKEIRELQNSGTLVGGDIFARLKKIK